MKKTWLQNSDNHLGDQLVYAGAAKKQKKLITFKHLRKKDQIQKTMQEDGHWYSNQPSRTFTLEVLPNWKFFVVGGQNKCALKWRIILRIQVIS